MAGKRLQELRDKLLDRLIHGEIDRSEYQLLLLRIEEREQAEQKLNHPAPLFPQDDGLSSLPTMARPIEPAALKSGMMIGKYRLESGQRGGMGQVWKAVDTHSEQAGMARVVALKFLPPELLGNEDEVARIKATFKLVEQLDHPHICRVFDLDEHPQFGWYQVMRWIDGQTLSAYRRDAQDQIRCLSVAEVAKLLRPVADALDYAHSRKVLHRDIKPQNIMVDRDGHLWVIDFGLAAEVRSSLTRVSKGSVELTGTQPYLAPELWEGSYATPFTDQVCTRRDGV